jgi:hypothetical protein
MVFAAFRKATLSLLLPLGILLDKTLPPLILLLGLSLSQLANCLAVGNFLMPFKPTSLIKISKVWWLNPSIFSKLIPSKYW